jgi:hypothetical protein
LKIGFIFQPKQSEVNAEKPELYGTVKFFLHFLYALRMMYLTTTHKKSVCNVKKIDKREKLKMYNYSYLLFFALIVQFYVTDIAGAIRTSNVK